MTSAQFDIETADRLARIQENPNPCLNERHWRSGYPNPRVEGAFSRISRCYKASVAWGRHLDRTAAIDSFKNVMAVIGVGTILADFGTMRVWMAAPCAIIAILVWYGDYLRHF